MAMTRFERINGLIDALSAGLVERRRHVQLALLAALAGEHTLLIGPPGTAKSELSRRLHTAFRDARYFERLLTRFSVPEELFGPLSIRALEEDRYERQTAGFLPEASIAFIDEVFKANSAILNALLTLLNEREFDNGAGRQRCPLISVIGATNAVPEDEVGEAFFDRFLMRLPVAPVSAAGFEALLKVSRGDTPIRPELALDDHDLAALAEAAGRVDLPASVTALLAELRRHCAEQQIIVSDRRWVKIVRLLRVAAAAADRASLSPWDLLLLPRCTAPDAERQAALFDWLTARLGVREAFSPALLTRVVEAFEAQLDLELKANDLDYDDSGRLKFSASAQAADIAASIGDAKGGSAAPRMTYTRQRRYGTRHVEARVGQIDDALARIGGYAEEIAQSRRDLDVYRAGNLWGDEALLARVAANLAGTAAAIGALADRLGSTREGFLALPRLDQDDARNDAVPAPVAHEGLAAA
jgi:MoxR-like ATPase